MWRQHLRHKGKTAEGPVALRADSSSESHWPATVGVEGIDRWGKLGFKLERHQTAGKGVRQVAKTSARGVGRCTGAEGGGRWGTLLHVDCCERACLLKIYPSQHPRVSGKAGINLQVGLWFLMKARRKAHPDIPLVLCSGMTGQTRI